MVRIYYVFAALAAFATSLLPLYLASIDSVLTDWCDVDAWMAFQKCAYAPATVLLVVPLVFLLVLAFLIMLGEFTHWLWRRNRG